MIKNWINIKEIVDLKIRKLNEIKDTINQLFWEISNFILKFENCSNGFDERYDNDIFLEYKNRIKELIDKGYNLVNDFIVYDFEFNPPNYNSFNNDSNNLLVNSFSFSDNYLSEESNKNQSYKSFCKLSQKLSSENEFSIKCINCTNNYPICICKTCNILICEECIRNHLQNFEKIHSIIKLKDSKEKEKYLFLNSISFIIKNLLIKCNYLLKRGIIKIRAKNRDNSNMKCIKKITQFSYINNNFTLEDEINFLTDLDQNYTDLKQTDNSQNSFHISELDKNLIDIIKNILNEKSNIIKDNSNFDLDVSNEDSSGEMINE